MEVNFLIEMEDIEMFVCFIVVCSTARYCIKKEKREQLDTTVPDKN